ncbi:MAG: glycolate oxidase subunit GlcF [Rhizomicrobium sp.]|jgi:glycolate oxidase iron-sulfur subunit
MRTNFTSEDLADPVLAEAERNLRACVHCGICTATCPTYVLLGDERDSPRGRIVMMQEMLEYGGAPSAETVFHIDRCLSCLGCRTACPSSVDYRRLADTARAHIETQYRRPLSERITRELIVRVLANRNAAVAAVTLARLFAPIATALPGALGRLARVAVKANRTTIPVRSAILPLPLQGGEERTTHRRIALVEGCVQPALAPAIDQAVSRVLARRRMTLVPLNGAGCCGALAHHLGRRDEAKARAKRMIAAFEFADRAAPFDAVLISATGCVAHVTDFAHLFLDEPEWQARAIAFAEKVRDFSQLVDPREARPPQRLKIAYQIPCSLQHGLQLSGAGEAQLIGAGFDVVAIPEGYLCCGSAGSYSILQPELAKALRARKLANIAALHVDAVASPNIGCLSHLSGSDAPPVVHPAELIDWADGGPIPAVLQNLVV